MMFDINGHYIFRSAGAFSFYGLAGLDILLTSKKMNMRILILLRRVTMHWVSMQVQE